MTVMVVQAACIVNERPASVSPLKITQTAGWAQQKTTSDYDDSTTA